MGRSKKFKPGGRQRLTEVLRWLDDELVEVGEIFEMWARRRKHRMDPEHKLAEERYQEERTLRKRLNYLRRKKLIKTKKTEKRLIYALTHSGRVELLKRLVNERPRLPRGQVCLVAYDIPLDASKGRDKLRSFLKGLGFVPVQKSLWETDKEVMNEIFDFAKKIKIQKWVQVIIAQRPGKSSN